MAERGVPKADGSAREAALHLPGLRPPRLLPHRPGSRTAARVGGPVGCAGTASARLGLPWARRWIAGAPPAGGDAPGGRSAAEEITGHKDETIPQVLVHDLHWSEVEVDAFGSFVQKSLRRLEIRPPRRAGWARVGDVGVRTGRLVLGWRGALGLRRMRSHRGWWRRPASAHRAREEWLGSAMVGPSIVGRLAASTGTRNQRESGGVRPWRPRPGWG
jgi:hypothetical protein